MAKILYRYWKFQREVFEKVRKKLAKIEVSFSKGEILKRR